MEEMEKIEAGELKETGELVDLMFKVGGQAIEAFKDGFQPADLAKFLDEAMDAPAAIRGINAIGPEAASASLDDVDKLFDGKRKLLTDAGLHPMVAGAIESNLKGLYFVIAAVKQRGEDLVS